MLSGFLIARKLLDEQEGGHIDLRAFWFGRVRRLLPAALTVLTAITLYTALLAEPVSRRGIARDVWAALLYVANWRFIVSDVGYFASTSAPSPVRHLWSLSVEEQFYLLFPLILLALAALGFRGRRTLTPLIVLIALSTFWTALLRTNGAEVTRLYEGTDTRLATILIGVATAVWLRDRPPPSRLPAATPVAAVVALGIVAGADGTQAWLYPWGQLGFALAAAALIASAATRPDAASTRGLGTPPLVHVGLLSYSLYLWHWPVYLVLTPARTGLEGPLLLLVRILTSWVFATLSFRLVEEPIRRRRLVIARPAALTLASIAAVAGLAALAVADAPASDRDFVELTGDRVAITYQSVDDLPPLEVPPDAVAPPAAPRDRPLRLALVGDSAGASLDWYRPDLENLDYRNGTIVGCGFMGPAHPIGQELEDRCRDWQDRWRVAIADDPDVVLIVLGAWEINPHVLPDGSSYLPAGADTSDETTAYLDRQLETAVELVRSETDARIALLELSCADVRALGVRDEDPPRGDPAITGWFNARLDALAGRHPGLVQIVSLDDRLCPDGRPISHHDGVLLRDDGTHWTEESAPIAWSWLLPMVEAVAYRPIS